MIEAQNEPYSGRECMNKKRLKIGGVLLFVLSSVFTFYFYQYAVGVEGVIQRSEVSIPQDSTWEGKEVIYISVISRYPPNIIYRGYQPLLDYLTNRTQYRFKLKLCTDYNEAVRLLITKQAAAAFLGSYVYIKAHQEHGVIPILKPLNINHEPFSRSVLFTSGSNPIYSVNDLRGKRIALPSEESYSANWLLHSVLRKHGLRTEDLGAAENFAHHQTVIDNVMRGTFDAGVTREHLIERMRNRNVRVLMYSDPFPSSPIVVARDYSPAVVEAVTEVLLRVKRLDSGPDDVTKGWDNEFIYGFVKASDADYDAVRAIRR